jgi:rhodanese-related sulfurtransferase
VESITQHEKIVRAAKQAITEVSIADVKAMLDKGEDFVLIDTRTDGEWQTGHLPQAQHLDRGRLESKIETAVADNNSHIIIYCGGGGRSALAAETLQKMNYTNVASMAGGYWAWQAAGYPLVDER